MPRSMPRRIAKIAAWRPSRFICQVPWPIATTLRPSEPNACVRIIATSCPKARLDLFLDVAQAVLPEEQLVADEEAGRPEHAARDRAVGVRDELLLHVRVRRTGE